MLAGQLALIVAALFAEVEAANIDGRPASRHLCFSSRRDPESTARSGGVIQRPDNNRMRHDCGLVAIR